MQKTISRLYYKLWKRLNKRKYVSPWTYSLHKYLSEKLIKIGIISEYVPLSRKKTPEELVENVSVGISKIQEINARIVEIKNFFDYDYRRLFYQQHINLLKIKHRSGKKIRVCFSVAIEATFPLRSVFEKMREDDCFDPFIAVIPYTAMGKEYQIEQYEKTKAFLLKKYPAETIVETYDEKRNDWIDISALCDFYCPPNPYDIATVPVYRISHFASKGIPVFFQMYGFTISKWHTTLVTKPEYNLFWRIYGESSFAKKELAPNFLNGENCRIAGCVKMDALALTAKKERSRKRVVIAPHHTIKSGALELGTFLRYADLFQKLPDLYPDMDFVFRPHQLLAGYLRRTDVWGNEKTDAYIRQMKSHANVEYQDGGDYFDTFVNSDALIHDCGSFMAEYLFSGHPACYLVKDAATNDKNFNEFGKECLARHYQAADESDIIRFIDDVVVGGRDPMKEERSAFVEKELKINYPNVAEYIINDIKRELV